MKSLDNEIKLKGVGKNISAWQLHKHESCYIYERDDGYFEIFKARIKDKEDVFGTEYDEREIYPCNEDFGMTAFTTMSYEHAIRIFNKLIKKYYGND